MTKEAGADGAAEVVSDGAAAAEAEAIFDNTTSGKEALEDGASGADGGTTGKKKDGEGEGKKAPVSSDADGGSGGDASKDADGKAKADGGGEGSAGSDGKAGDKKTPTPDEVRAQRADQIEKEQKFSEMILSMRPDAFEVADSPEFLEWLKSQPATVQAATQQKDDWQAALRVLEAFDRHLAASKKAAADGEADDKKAKKPEGDATLDLAAIKFKANDGKEMTLADFGKPEAEGGYGPEVVNAIVAAAQHIVEQKLQGLAVGGGEKAGDRTEIMALRQEMEGMRFRNSVLAEHPDAVKVVKTPVWKTWYEKQPQAIKKLWSDGPDPGDAVAVLDKFKEDEAARQAEEAKTGARKKKEAHDGFHGSTLRSGGAKEQSGAGDDGSGDDGAAQSEAEDEFRKLTKEGK